MTQYPKAVLNNSFISTVNYQTWCLKVYFKDKAWIIIRLLIELEERNDQWSHSRGEYLLRRSLSQLPFVPIYSGLLAWHRQSLLACDLHHSADSSIRIFAHQLEQFSLHLCCDRRSYLLELLQGGHGQCLFSPSILAHFLGSDLQGKSRGR
jgi:hypothetical protein